MARMATCVRHPREAPPFLLWQERAKDALSASAGQGRAAMDANAAPPRRSKPCYEENAWLKGSNGIFG